MTKEKVSYLSSQTGLNRDILAKIHTPRIGRRALVLFLPFLVAFTSGCASQAAAITQTEITQSPKPIPTIIPEIQSEIDLAAPTIRPRIVDCGVDGKGWEAPDGKHYGFIVGGNVSSNMVLCEDESSSDKP